MKLTCVALVLFAFATVSCSGDGDSAEGASSPEASVEPTPAEGAPSPETAVEQSSAEGASSPEAVVEEYGEAVFSADGADFAALWLLMDPDVRDTMSRPDYIRCLSATFQDIDRGTKFSWETDSVYTKDGATLVEGRSRAEAPSMSDDETMASEIEVVERYGRWYLANTERHTFGCVALAQSYHDDDPLIDTARSYCQQEWDDGEFNADESEEDSIAGCLDSMLMWQWARDHAGDLPDAAVPIDRADLPARVADQEQSYADPEWYFVEGPGETVTYIERRHQGNTVGEAFYVNFYFIFGDCDAAKAEHEVYISEFSCTPNMPDAAVLIDTADLPAFVAGFDEPYEDSEWYLLEGPGEAVTYIEIDYSKGGLWFVLVFGDCDAASAEYPEVKEHGRWYCNPEPRYPEPPGGGSSPEKLMELWNDGAAEQGPEALLALVDPEVRGAVSLRDYADCMFDKWSRLPSDAEFNWETDSVYKKDGATFIEGRFEMRSRLGKQISPVAVEVIERDGLWYLVRFPTDPNDPKKLGCLAKASAG